MAELNALLIEKIPRRLNTKSGDSNRQVSAQVYRRLTRGEDSLDVPIEKQPSWRVTSRVGIFDAQIELQGPLLLISKVPRLNT